jgi:hypothetical protein
MRVNKANPLFKAVNHVQGGVSLVTLGNRLSLWLDYPLRSLKYALLGFLSGSLRYYLLDEGKTPF